MSTVQWGPSQTTLPNIVTIGTQTWMNSNLQTVRYNNGDPIPEVQDPTRWASLTTGAWCYYNNDPDLGDIYGKLYNWYAVNDARGIAPQGWRVPTDTDWTTLTTFLGGEDLAGEPLKTTGITYWQNPNYATNSSGFSALPGGYRTGPAAINGEFGLITNQGYWWSSTQVDSSTAWYRNMYYYNTTVNRASVSKKFGMSVRLVKI